MRPSDNGRVVARDGSEPEQLGKILLTMLELNMSSGIGWGGLLKDILTGNWWGVALVGLIVVAIFIWRKTR